MPHSKSEILNGQVTRATIQWGLEVVDGKKGQVGGRVGSCAGGSIVSKSCVISVSESHAYIYLRGPIEPLHISPRPF